LCSRPGLGGGRHSPSENRPAAGGSGGGRDQARGGRFRGEAGRHRYPGRQAVRRPTAPPGVVQGRRLEAGVRPHAQKKGGSPRIRVLTPATDSVTSARHSLLPSCPPRATSTSCGLMLMYCLIPPPESHPTPPGVVIILDHHMHGRAVACARRKMDRYTNICCVGR